MIRTALKRLVVLTIGAGVAYLSLMEGRTHNADPEIRGWFAGVFTILVMQIADKLIPPRES